MRNKERKPLALTRAALVQGQPSAAGTPAADERQDMRRHRNVKIVATLGPASNDYKMIRALHEAGPMCSA